MAEPRPTQLHRDDIEGWEIMDYFYALLIEVRKLNCRLAGVDRVHIDDPDSKPSELLEVLGLASQQLREVKPANERGKKLGQMIAEQKAASAKE